MKREMSSSTYLEEESSALQGAKEDFIRHCLARDSVDLWRLRELALTKGGLVNGKFWIESVLHICFYEDYSNCSPVSFFYS